MWSTVITTARLHRCGELLFGPEWQSPLARALNVNIRTVQRWAAGEHPPPQSVWTEIRRLLQQRRVDITEALRTLR